jgi:hypothetical protein
MRRRRHPLLRHGPLRARPHHDQSPASFASRGDDARVRRAREAPSRRRACRRRDRALHRHESLRPSLRARRYQVHHDSLAQRLRRDPRGECHVPGPRASSQHRPGGPHPGLAGGLFLPGADSTPDQRVSGQQTDPGLAPMDPAGVLSRLARADDC